MKNKIKIKSYVFFKKIEIEFLKKGNKIIFNEVK